ncbi:carboxypeptidase-like regulatory domain-containing protein [Larkinella soli]|uniref:carboxypeptidase-like regulatory domain-containing protein n=1 Tax=Larkinella soli TaxID=1770527 RepID=UPI000FFB7384|nr:carboxypeptidase-like regulatory domain-containing protein [Larkinella soli]
MKTRFFHRCLLLAALLGFVVRTASAQTGSVTLTGRVTDAATGKPLPFASVYLNSTTQGTTTNEQGRFRLTGVPLGTVELVASYLGYQPVRQSLRLDNDQTREVNLRLKSTGLTLADVTVTAKKNKSWLRQFREFERQLLGDTPFRSQCGILNPNVLRFTEENHHLKAEAAEPVVVENRALGYRIIYDLQYFDLEKGGVLYYAGATRFEELKPADARQTDRWAANRRRAYLGSLRHLLASLIAGTWEQEGFMVYSVNPAFPQVTNGGSLLFDVNRHLLPIDPKTLFRPGRLSFERKLVTTTPLKVFYTRLYSSSRSTFSPYRDAPYAYTELRFPQGGCEVTVDGRVTLPMGMLAIGYLGNDRLSTLLPENWTHTPGGEAAPGTAPTLMEGQILASDYRLDSLTKRWREKHPYQAPAVFAHIDKPFYFTGDQLWLSAYVLDAATSQMLFGEGALHVDLLTPGGKMVQHQWLRITEGRAAGQFRFSDSLATGLYRLRAYTDEDFASARPAFERSVTVYNLARGTDSAPLTTDTLDLQFLPEGGRWIAGLPNRLGFKALGPDGRGRSVSGRVVDEGGREVARFTGNRFGMGSVVLNPEAGKAYFAEVPYAGRTQRRALPAVEPAGFVLTADAVSDTAFLTVRVLAAGQKPDAVVYLTLQSYGQLIQRTKMQLKDGKARLSLTTAVLPAGLCAVTLYDGNGQARAERLVFIPDRVEPVKVLALTDKPGYKPREQVLLNLHLDDRTTPSRVSVLSVSVTDADQVPEDSTEADIRTHLLLTGDLRGRVENPGFYFRDTTAATRRALDDLLLTQGWRRIGLRTPVTPTDTLGGIVLSGRVLDEKRRPIPNAQLLFASPNAKQAFSYSISANERGQFRLAGLGVSDTLQMLVQVMDIYFKAVKATLEIDTVGSVWAQRRVVPEPSPDWKAFQQQLEAARSRQEADPDLYRDKKVKVLKEVTVKGYRPPERPEHIKRMSIHGDPDAVIEFDENAPPFANVYEMMRGRVPGVLVSGGVDGYQVNIRGSFSFGGNNRPQANQPLYLLDGTYITENEEGTTLFSISPNDVERIEVLKNAGTAAIYGSRAANGVIAIYTKRGMTGRNRAKANNPYANVGLSRLSLIGFPPRREFYVPRYEDTAAPSEATTRIDRRDVLYWKPFVETDSKGNSILAFPLSDVVRTLRVVVQGVTREGRPVVGVSLLRVQ